MALEMNTTIDSNESIKELNVSEANASKLMTNEGGSEETRENAKNAVARLTNRQKIKKRDELLTKLIWPSFNPKALHNSRVNMQPAFEDTFDKWSNTFDFSGLTQNQTMTAIKALLQGIENRTINSRWWEVSVKFNTADGGNIWFIAPLIIGAQQAYWEQTINMIPNQWKNQKDQFQHILPILKKSGLMDNVTLNIPSKDYANYKDTYGDFIADGGPAEWASQEKPKATQPIINLNQPERIKG